MQKLLLSFLVFIFILTTVIVIMNPRLHKAVSIPGSNTDIALQNKEMITDKSSKIQNIDNIKNTQTKVKNIDNLKAVKDPSLNNQDNFQNIEGQLNNVNNIQDNDLQFSHQKESPFLQKIKEREKDRIKEIEKNAQQYTEKRKTHYTQRPQVVIKQQPEPTASYNYTKQKPSQNTTQYGYAERDLTISWNVWRSNLGNYIADDFEQWAPGNGTYMFVFNVNRYRQISNPKVFLLDLSFASTDLSSAYSYLNRLSGSSILEFPQGSQREKVSAVYTILISDHTNDKSLDASNFSDYETLR